MNIVVKQLLKGFARQAMTTVGTCITVAGATSGASKEEVILGAVVTMASYLWTLTHNTTNVSFPITPTEKVVKDGL